LDAVGDVQVENCEPMAKKIARASRKRLIEY
jgi:hypothetical protein